MPEWVTALFASQVLATFISGHRHTCVCEFVGRGVDTQVLELVSRQLDRCGPEQLTRPACPACPTLTGVCGAAIGGAFIVGVCVGILVSLVFAVARGRAGRRPSVTSRAAPGMDRNSEESAQTTPPARLALRAIAATPSARRLNLQ